MGLKLLRRNKSKQQVKQQSANNNNSNSARSHFDNSDGSSTINTNQQKKKKKPYAVGLSHRHHHTATDTATSKITTDHYSSSATSTQSSPTSTSSTDQSPLGILDCVGGQQQQQQQQQLNNNDTSTLTSGYSDYDAGLNPHDNNTPPPTSSSSLLPIIGWQSSRTTTKPSSSSSRFDDIEMARNTPEPLALTRTSNLPQQKKSGSSSNRGGGGGGWFDFSTSPPSLTAAGRLAKKHQKESGVLPHQQHEQQQQSSGVQLQKNDPSSVTVSPTSSPGGIKLLNKHHRRNNSSNGGGDHGGTLSLKAAMQREISKHRYGSSSSSSGNNNANVIAQPTITRLSSQPTIAAASSRGRSSSVPRNNNASRGSSKSKSPARRGATNVALQIQSSRSGDTTNSRGVRVRSSRSKERSLSRSTGRLRSNSQGRTTKHNSVIDNSVNTSVAAVEEGAKNHSQNHKRMNSGNTSSFNPLMARTSSRGRTPPASADHLLKKGFPSVEYTKGGSYEDEHTYQSEYTDNDNDNDNVSIKSSYETDDRSYSVCTADDDDDDDEDVATYDEGATYDDNDDDDMSQVSETFTGWLFGGVLGGGNNDETTYMGGTTEGDTVTVQDDESVDDDDKNGRRVKKKKTAASAVVAGAAVIGGAAAVSTTLTHDREGRPLPESNKMTRRPSFKWKKTKDHHPPPNQSSSSSPGNNNSGPPDSSSSVKSSPPDSSSSWRSVVSTTSKSSSKKKKTDTDVTDDEDTATASVSTRGTNKSRTSTFFDKDDKQQDICCVGQDGVENLIVRKYNDVPIPNASNHILIKVEASTVSTKDCEARLKGTSSYNDVRVRSVPGYHVVGTVHSLGDEVEYSQATRQTFRVGDRVAALLPNGGGNARYVSVPKHTVMSLPNNTNHEDTICLIANYVTAYQCLKLAKKEGLPLTNANVLIIGGSEPVGQALVELAVREGARVYTTAHKMHEEHLTSLGARYFNVKPSKWLPTLEGKMDVVIDSICIDGYESSYRALTPDGTLVCNTTSTTSSAFDDQHGHEDGTGCGGCDDGSMSTWWSTIKAKYFWNRAIFYDLFESYEQNPKMFVHELHYLICKLDRGEIRPKVAGKVALNQVPKAQKLIEKGLPNGTVVCHPWKKLDPKQNVTIVNLEPKRQ